MQKDVLILLVDDDEDEYVLLKDMLGEMPAWKEYTRVHLDWASSLESGLAASQEKEYDLYLVDYYLGQETGLDLMRTWAERGSTTPVVFLTGQTSYDIDLAIMQEGAYDYLAKGALTPFALERAIRYTLERKRAIDELEERVRERTRELAQVNESLRAEIAARERVEQALRASEARMRTLAETTSAAIFIVQDSDIRYANHAARFVTGYQPHELTGMKFWQLAHPAYQASLKQYGLIRQWIRGMPTRFELKIITAAGQERWVDITAGEIEYENQLASVITAFDITERDQIEKELQTAKIELETRVQERTAELETERARLRAVIENAPGAIVMADKNGRIVLANPVAEQIIGQSLSAEQGSRDLGDYNLCYPDGQPYNPQDLILSKAAVDGKTYSNVEMMVRRPDGQKRFILADATPVLDTHGNLYGAVSIFQDITRRKQREQEIEEGALRSEVLATLSQSFAQAGLEYQAVLDTIALKISETLSDGCIIRLVNQDSQWLEPVALHFNQPAVQAAFETPVGLLREPMGTGLVGSVARTGEPMVMLDTTTEQVAALLRPEAAEVYRRLDIVSLLVEPLRTQQRILGTMTIVRTRPSLPYTPQDETFFADLAERAALAIENAMLHAEVKQLALHDSLTGQYNRRAFFELGKEEVRLFQRYNRPLSAIMLDVDNFKKINDQYGHALGDHVLRAVIELCRENIRDTDILGRYGGDEYAILLPRTSLPTAHMIALRIHQAISSTPYISESGPVPVSVSLGVTEANQTTRDIDQLLEQADRALYSAKRKGRNRVEKI